MAGKPPKYRVKVKFGDKRKQTFTMRDGSKASDVRRELGVIWEDEEGRLTFRFAADLEVAMGKVLGAKGPDDRFFCDVFPTDDKPVEGGKAPANTRRATKPAAADDTDTDW